MLNDDDNIFDTPRLRYNKLRKEFYRKYLNPKAWSYRCDTKELAQAYHDLIEYLEKTEHFRCLTPSLHTDIPTDNINLVIHELPFSRKRREELIEFVVCGMKKGVEQSQENELLKIKEYLEMKKRGALVGVERKSDKEIEDYRRAANEEMFAEVNVKKTAEVKKDKRKKMENEILEIRQQVYSKLDQGQSVLSIMKKFKRKMEKFLKTFKADLSYVEQKHWKDKIIITEKAVIRRGKELKAAQETCLRKDKNLAPSVREIFDAARAQELLIENLPVPLEVDEIEEKLERLKKFNKNLLDDKNETAAKEVIKVKADRMDNVKVDKNDKKDDIFDVDEFLGKNLVWGNDNAYDYDEEESEDDAFDTNIEENVEEECSKSKVNTEFKNDEKRCVNESEEQYKAEVKEFNNWYYKKLEERKHNVKVDKTTKPFDKVVKKKPSIEEEMYDDLMYKQLFDCNEKEVGKETDGSRIVTLLQAIFALLLVCGKTLHEQSVKINHLSKLSHPSLLSHLQPEAPLFPRSPCSCQNKPRVCCEITDAFLIKVSGMVSTASSGVLWCKEVYSAFKCVKMRTVRAAKVRLVNLVGHAIGLDFGVVLLQLADEDY